MLDVWLGGAELTTVCLIVSAVALLPIQLLLCFRVRSRMIRLLPVVVLALTALIFCCKAVTSTDWDSFGYTFLAILAGLMLFMCGIGWGIWAIVGIVKKRR